MLDIQLNEMSYIVTRIFFVGLWILPVCAALCGFSKQNKLFILAIVFVFCPLVISISLQFRLSQLGELSGAAGMQMIAWLVMIGLFVGSLALSLVLFF
ncbi:MAG: hypothetical protein AAF234_07630 [Pseudomonadota bacterium]